MNLTFYPGPSQLYPSVADYLHEAYQSGILSMNHRSQAFMKMLERTLADLHDRLDIPADYEIYFTSSATECWEIIAQSLIDVRSLHVCNGAFGQKWYAYTQRLIPDSVLHTFDLNEGPGTDFLAGYPAADVLCLTHNETSNATVLPSEVLTAFRKRFDGVIAVDATSSMAGVALPWQEADVWFASVQKCFGLPPGLGVMVVSPRAILKAEQKGDRRYYNSLLFIRENFLNFQTPYTPNTLAIYLLGKVMQQVPPIREVDALIRSRAENWYQFLSQISCELLVENPEVRSPTVIALRGTPDWVRKLKERAMAEGIVLGNGYGKWKGTSLRIANFPAIAEGDIRHLQNFLQSNIS